MDAVERYSYELFPPIEPYDHGMLTLSGGHEMYWEQSGNPDGEPALFLHGGPGAGASSFHRRFFDPRHYRIVIFDQRGAGRSRPFAGTGDNTTGHLVEDIEALRRHLNIERWMVFGGSWGSTLALYYAIHHPDRCTSLVLRGIFLARKKELDWFMTGMGIIFPEAWRAFMEFLPEQERHDPQGAYYRRLMNEDPEVHMPAARAWSAYENACSKLIPAAGAHSNNNSSQGGKRRRTPQSWPLIPTQVGGAGILDLARLEAHYFVNAMFMEEGFILEHIDAIRDIPGVIVQGRYDMVCPIVTADELARAWPEADYVIVPDAGHTALEPGIRSALIETTERFKSLK
ncbi:MAG: prolyl aminopeptidase [Rhodospirillales bacterium]|nr:prolyl aminopeptidase [Rhodospirillales bacterium]